MPHIKRIFIFVGVLLFMCYAVTNAQVNWHKYSYFQNYGGLNDNLSSTEIADNEATDIQNVIFDTGGAIKKRFGYVTVPDIPQRVATGTDVCVNGISFFKLNSGSRFLVAICNADGKATAMEQSYQAGGGVSNVSWVNIDNVGLSGSYTNNIQPSFAVAENILVFTDGTSTGYPYKWTGTGKSAILSTDADLPTGKIVVYHKNQLFVANNSTYPSRVWFSNLDDITAWDALDFFDVQTADGTQVTGMVSTFDSLYVFKDKSIWRLSGSNKDDFTLQKMVDGVGTLSNASIKVVNNFIYFTTAQGDIAIYDGGYSVKFISQKIRGTIGGLSFNRAGNTCGVAFSSYKYNDYDYYCSVSNSPSSTNNLILMFDTAYNAWTKFKGMNANCMTVGDDSNGKNALYFGDYSGYVHQYPTSDYYDGSVATDAIVAYYQTKWFRYPEVALGDKYWRLLKTYAISEVSGSIVNIDCRSDYETVGKEFNFDLLSESAKWDTAVWDVDKWAGEVILIERDEVEKGNNMFQIKYSNETVNEGFTIIGWETFIEGTERI